MATCTGFIEPLNLRCLLVNTFAGNSLIFILISFIFVLGTAAYFRMSGTVASLLIVILTIFLGVFLEIMWIKVLVVMIIGLLVYNILAKIVKN